MRYAHHAFSILLALMLAPLALAQDEAIPHTFKSGDAIEAAKMNENFQALLALVDVDELPASCTDGDLLGWDGTTWECFTPAADEPRTESLTIPGAALVGVDGTRIQRDHMGAACLEKDGWDAAAIAPLALPQGSTITNVTYTHLGLGSGRQFVILESTDPSNANLHFEHVAAPSFEATSDSVDGALQVEEGHAYSIGVINPSSSTTCDQLHLISATVTYQRP